MVEFDKKVLLLGCGAVGQCALPLLFKHIRVAPGNVTVMDFEDKTAILREWTGQGVTFVQNRVTPENLAALLRYGKLSSFHTYLSRAAAYAMGIFIGVLFCFGFHLWLMRLALGVFLVATGEEFVLLGLLPTWTADVRGTWWVLRKRAAPAGP